MPARSVGIFTVDFPDPATLPTPQKSNRFRTLNANHSFQFPISSNIRTLSTHNAPPGGDDPYGLLYVPDLVTDHCKLIESDHVLENTTRVSNLPANTNYSLIALAPWLIGHPECMQEYFTSARNQITKSFLVYQPGNSLQMPPPMNDESWGLEDGGSWKEDNPFPFYALAPITGTIVMNQLSLYSGNISDVPSSEELLEVLKPDDYVRLWAIIDLQSNNNLPSFWVFLVIVLALLLVIVGGISIAMHVVQRRRREDLRQRVLRGDVDLEALGIKRLTVPKLLLDKMPVYIFTKPPEAPLPKVAVTFADLGINPMASSPNLAHEAGVKAIPPTLRPSSTPSLAPLPAFSQPTCAICLEDFVPDVTEVRELPCRHIFHPDCIDTFLLRNSSLCPMCKTSTLPPGCCPTEITSTMVRRERMIQRIRQRSIARRSVDIAPLDLPPPTASFGSRISRLIRILRETRGTLGAPNAPGPPAANMEMVGEATTIQSIPSRRRSSVQMTGASLNIARGAQFPRTETAGSRPSCTSPSPQSRREWARQRALTMLGRGNGYGADVEPADESTDNTARRPLAKRLLHMVFPGFR